MDPRDAQPSVYPIQTIPLSSSLNTPLEGVQPAIRFEGYVYYMISGFFFVA